MNPPSFDCGVELSAINGANPLGFLTALGALVTLRQGGHIRAKLAWRQTTHWTPVLHGLATTNLEEISQNVSTTLRGKEIPKKADQERETAQGEFDAAKKAFKDKLTEMKKRKLKGRERMATREKEVVPLESAMKEKREIWLAALKRAVPSEELALGKQIDCTPDEYREHAEAFLETATSASRQFADFLAAFGSDVFAEKSGRISATPFCFVTGSGHQYFLDTVRQLIERITVERVTQALFRTWEYRDEKLSMRWDPVDDKRYALMNEDPGPLGAHSVWMANLLAYRSLVLFPSAATVGRTATTAWDQTKSDSMFTWPIWGQKVDPEVIRSILQLKELHGKELDHQTLRARGVVAVFRSRRIQVGNPPLHKINFTPARSV